MKFKTHIEDPETLVCLQIHLISGGKIFSNMAVKFAREAMVSWKKYVLYASIPVEKRDPANPPVFFYHFLEGDLERPETLTSRLSFLFQNVVGMHYDEIDLDQEAYRLKLHERGVKATEILAKAAEKQVDELDEGEEWRKKEGE